MYMLYIKLLSYIGLTTMGRSRALCDDTGVHIQRLHRKELRVLKARIHALERVLYHKQVALDNIYRSKMRA